MTTMQKLLNQIREERSKFPMVSRNICHTLSDYGVQGDDNSKEYQQETLYTEEQVREAYIHAYMLEADADERENAIQSANYYIQSLKQPKKD